MAKVTVHEKPIPGALAQMTSQANDIKVVTDKTGRVLKLKRPDFIAQFRLTKALGPVADNTAYQAMIFPILYLVAIDDQDIFPPKSDLEVEAILSKLDSHGYAALTDGIKANFADVDEDERESVKNS